MIKKSLFVFLLFLLLLSGSCSRTSNDTTPKKQGASGPMFFEITSEGKTHYLFGSIHVANETFYPLPEKVMQAYENSDELILEANYNSIFSGLGTPEIVKKMVVEEKKLKDAMSPKDYDLLLEKLKKYDLPETTKNTTPILIAQTLSSKYLEELGFKFDQGIDLFFFKNAQKQGKPIEALETAEFQLNLFLDIPFDQQIFYLSETLNKKRGEFLTIKKIADFWKQGDEKSFQEFLNEDLKEDKFHLYDSILFDRNKSMTETLTQKMKEGKTLFTTVGTLHLIGDRGIPALLKKQGYTIRRVTYDKTKI